MQASEQAPIVWQPNPGPQTRFLASTAFEALYGGAAGGGKSDALLMDALRYIDVPGYRALLLRRTFPELLRSLIPKSFRYYLALNGKPNMSSMPQWKFPSGAVIEFGHLQHEHDVHNYQSAEYQYIGFDELTSFTEAMFVYMQSRLRGVDGIPKRMRAGTNPGGEGHDWVFRRFGPWLDKESAIKAKPGERLYFKNTKDGPVFCSRFESNLSRVFYPAKVSDNPHLDEGYEEILGGLDRVSRAQLLDGNWMAKPAAGAYYKRSWFRIIDAAPSQVTGRVRHWDLAATAPSEGNDPDWTVGVKMARTKDGMFIIEDITRFRESPGAVEQAIRNTAEADGKGCSISIPQDPGQAGKSQSKALALLLAGFVFSSKPETGDKVTRQKPLSAQAEAGNVALVRGPWLEKFFQELEAFPSKGVHDDQVDAAAGAFDALCSDKAAWIARFTAGMRNK